MSFSSDLKIIPVISAFSYTSSETRKTRQRRWEEMGEEIMKTLRERRKEKKKGAIREKER